MHQNYGVSPLQPKILKIKKQKFYQNVPPLRLIVYSAGAKLLMIRPKNYESGVHFEQKIGQKRPKFNLIQKAKVDLQKLNITPDDECHQPVTVVPEKCLPSIVVYSRMATPINYNM